MKIDTTFNSTFVIGRPEPRWPRYCSENYPTDWCLHEATDYFVVYAQLLVQGTQANYLSSMVVQQSVYVSILANCLFSEAKTSHSSTRLLVKSGFGRRCLQQICLFYKNHFLRTDRPRSLTFYRFIFLYEFISNFSIIKL